MDEPMPRDANRPRVIGLLLAPVGAVLAYLPTCVILGLLRHGFESTKRFPWPTIAIELLVTLAIACPVAWLTAPFALRWLDARGRRTLRNVTALGAAIGLAVVLAVIVWNVIVDGGNARDWVLTVKAPLFLGLAAGCGAGSASFACMVEERLVRAGRHRTTPRAPD